VKVGKPKDANEAKNGTKLSRGANFKCVMSGTPITADHVRGETKAGRMGARLMAMVAQGERTRAYLPPTKQMDEVARQRIPEWKPEGLIVADARAFTPTLYGMAEWSDLLTPRQLCAMTTLSDLVQPARKRVNRDASTADMPDDNKPLAGGGTGAAAYADAVAIYLALAMDKVADYNSSLVLWSPTRDQVKTTFSRQALPMTWDFAETNVFANAAGDIAVSLDGICRTLATCGLGSDGHGYACDSQTQAISLHKVVSTDPPYYDNVPYADLSDFFYVWLRRSLKPAFPDLFSTLAVPKAEELVAFAYRHDGKQGAEAFFLVGMTQAMRRLAEQTHPAFPVTIYYAFKQSESENDVGTASTGWETFLDAAIQAGFALSGTWPMRTEREARSRGLGSNALASSIVLVCRPRAADAHTATRGEFVTALKAELPQALAHLQRGNIAPVDLAQAAIGPGMPPDVRG